MSTDLETLRVTGRGIFVPMALVAVLVGGVWNAALQHAAVQSLTIELAALKRQVSQRDESAIGIDRRLARVEILLETIADRLPREDRPGGPR